MENKKELKINFYSREQVKEMISLLKEKDFQMNEVCRDLAKKYDRNPESIRSKMYQLKHKLSTDLIHQNQPIVEQKQPADIGIEVPHGMTFEGTPKKIMLHSDHFIIYF
jgi:DNA relaxase NicK